MKSIQFKRYFNWEYWPSYMFYVPVVPYALYLAFRAKSFVFFSATNPAIKHSGNGSESKFSTIQLIPSKFRPVSILINANNPIEKTLEEIQKTNIQFPLIIKPDIGFRGLLVRRIKTKNELITYLKQHKKIQLIAQEFIEYKNECGILYHRIPDKSKGQITSITLKKYLTIFGNGTSTLVELIQQHKRARFYLPLLKELHHKNLDIILKNNEKKVLNVIGNHSKGTQFINGNHLISFELEFAIDKIFQQIPNWYFGRLDLKYNSIEELIQLENFKIIEINGIISEPTHIYDPIKSSYFNALKEIRKHWKIIFKIAISNHKINNIAYDTTRDFLESINQLRKYIQQIKAEN